MLIIMKKSIVINLLMLLIAVPLMTINAQDKKEKEIDLNEYLGVRLYKVFETFGNPNDLFCSADGKNETIIDYGSFAFQIGHKTVTIVYFWNNFHGTVFGVSIGSSMDDLEKTYGKPSAVKKSKIDGTAIWIFNIEKTDRMFIVFFDKNGKIDRMQIEWLN